MRSYCSTLMNFRRLQARHRRANGGDDCELDGGDLIVRNHSKLTLLSGSTIYRGEREGSGCGEVCILGLSLRPLVEGNESELGPIVRGMGSITLWSSRVRVSLACMLEHGIVPGSVCWKFTLCILTAALTRRSSHLQQSIRVWRDASGGFCWL